MSRISFAVVWVVSLLVTAGVAYNMNLSTYNTSVDSISIEPPKSDLSSVEVDDAEIQRLREELKSLREQLRESRNQNLRDALTEALVSAAKRDRRNDLPGSEDIGGFLERQFSVSASQENQMFGGLEASLRVLAIFSRLGDEGTDFLLGVLEEESGYSAHEKQNGNGGTCPDSRPGRAGVFSGPAVRR